MCILFLLNVECNLLYDFYQMSIVICKHKISIYIDFHCAF